MKKTQKMLKNSKNSKNEKNYFSSRKSACNRILDAQSLKHFFSFFDFPLLELPSEKALLPELLFSSSEESLFFAWRLSGVWFSFSARFFEEEWKDSIKDGFLLMLKGLFNGE